MAEDRPAVPLSRLRDLLAQCVEADSIRGVAREVGLPPNGLKYFLEGGAPRQATRRKLEAWFVRRAARGSASDPDAGRAALSILVRCLPPAYREIAQDRVVALIRELCDQAGALTPAWLSPPDANPPQD